MTPREQFQALLKELAPVSILERQVEMENDLLAAYQRKYPKARVKISHIDTALVDVSSLDFEEIGTRWTTLVKLKPKFEEDFARIVEEHHARLDAQLDQYKAKKEEIKRQLGELAEKIPLENGKSQDFRQVYSVSTSLYRSQGWGCEKYTRTDAEAQALLFDLCGVKTEIRHQDFEYQVWAQCSELDAKIVQHREGPSLKEHLQWLWNRGVNPRVYYPYLPHGLEEKLGVTFG